MFFKIIAVLLFASAVHAQVVQKYDIPVVNKISVVQDFVKDTKSYQLELKKPVCPEAPIPLRQVKRYSLKTSTDYDENDGRLIDASAAFYEGDKLLWSFKGDMNYDGESPDGPLFFPDNGNLLMFKERVGMSGEMLVRKNGDVIFDTDKAIFTKDYRFVAYRDNEVQEAFCVLGLKSGSKGLVKNIDYSKRLIAFDNYPFFLLVSDSKSFFKYDVSGKMVWQYSLPGPGSGYYLFLGLTSSGKECVFDDWKNSQLIILNWFTGAIVKSLPFPNIKSGDDVLKTKDIKFINESNVFVGMAYKDYDPKYPQSNFYPTAYIFNFNGDVLWQQLLKPALDTKFYVYSSETKPNNKIVFIGPDVIGFSYQIQN